MSKVALKLVSRAEFYAEEGEFWSSDEENAHSLHFSISLPDSFSPGLVSYFLKKYSSKDDVVLDPFCGRGTVPLEASLLGRTAVASDINPICFSATQAKLTPVDLVEVALFIQSVNFSKPVSLDGYSEYFEPFYDPDTYRELVNLKSYIQSNRSDVSNFVQMIGMSLLHGHTAGYFSGYSLPQISVSPSRQREMNDKRGTLPEFRALAPRILRKAGAVLRDGDVGRLQSRRGKHQIFQSECRNLSFLNKSTVDLVITSPPRPYVANSVNDLWLKNWFVGLSKTERDELRHGSLDKLDLDEWLLFMNESLFELARVVKSGGRVVIDLKRSFDGVNYQDLDEHLSNLINTNLTSYWENECLYVNRPTVPQLSKKFKEDGQVSRTSKVLVIRRK